MVARPLTGLGLCLTLSLVILVPDARATEPWSFHSPLPQGNDLHAVWAAGPGDLYVGGHGGVILHWDGNVWTPMQTPTQKTIFSIDGLSSNDIWAVGGDAYASDAGDKSLILHYDGSEWTEVTPPNLLGQTYVLRGVHAIASDDVWATVDGGPSLIHWDGTQWELVIIPLAVEGQFYNIASVGSDHLFVVGNYGQILHRDQGVWKLEQKLETGFLTVNILTAIWAYDLNTVYAGGTYGQVYRRTNEGAWTDLELPTALGEDNQVNFLTGFSPTDLYLLGGSSVRTYDGSTPPTRYDFLTDLRRGWYTGTNAGDRIYAVGPAGAVHEVLPQSGEAPVVSPLSAGKYSLNGIGRMRATGCGEGFLVFGDTYHTQTSPLQYFDGTEILKFPNPLPEFEPAGFVRTALAGGFDDIVINFFGSGATVRHWDGTAWNSLGTPNLGTTPRTVLDFWRSPAGTLYACGQLEVYRFDGPEWSVVLPFTELPDGVSLAALWGRSDSDLFVGSSNGLIWRYDGAAWSQETTPGTASARGLARLAGTSSETYAVGGDGLAWRRSETAWEQMGGVATNTGEDFYDLIADGDRMVACQGTPAMYIGGGLGRLWSFMGPTAELFQEGISEPIMALARTAGGDLFGIGSANGNTVILTDNSVGAGYSAGRVDLSLDRFQPLGDSGISVKPGALSAEKPWVAGRRLDRSPALFGMDLPLAGHQWAVLYDQGFGGKALPPCAARFGYDPAQLPEGFIFEQGALFRNDGTDWEPHPSLVDPVAQFAFLTEPVDLSPWALAQTLETPTPGPSFTPTETPSPPPTSTPTVTPDALERTPVPNVDLKEDGHIDAYDLLDVYRWIQDGTYNNDALLDFSGYWMQETVGP